MPDDVPGAYYVTTIDRLGLAVLTGGAVSGTLALAFADTGSAAGAIGAWITGIAIATVGIVAVAGPVWAILHRSKRRGPVAAAACTGLATFALLVFVQMLGGGGGGYRLASAIATSLPIAAVAAIVGAIMHRVAYRRLL